MSELDQKKDKKLELAKSEIEKAQKIINRLTKDKDKLKKKDESSIRTLKEKDAEVKAREDAIEELSKKMLALQKDNEWKEAEVSNMKTNKLELEAKLGDSKATIESNKTYIQELNKQLNEQRRGPSGLLSRPPAPSSAVGSSFKPTFASIEALGGPNTSNSVVERSPYRS